MGKRTNTAAWVESQNRWRINVQKDGERKSFYSSVSGRNGQREANAKADAWLDDDIADGNIKSRDLFKSYIKNLKEIIREDSARKEESYGNKWILPVIGNKKIIKVNDDDLQTILDNAYVAGLSKKTISNIRATAFSFIRFARRKKVTTYYPDEVKIRKDARVGERKILQPEDLVTLFTSDETVFKGKVVTDPYIHLYRFAVLTGLRPGEIYGLKRADRKGTKLYIRRSINEKGDVTEGKNANAIRMFQLTPSAIAEWDAQKKLTPFNEQAFYDGHPKGLLRYWQRYCAHNNIPYVTLYEIRHTFVSIVKELPESWLKPLIGHSKAMDSYGTYGHEVKGEREATANKIEQIFKDILSA